MPTARGEELAGVKRAERRFAEFRERATSLTVDRGTSDSVLRPRATGRPHPGQSGPGREAEEGLGQENRDSDAGGIREAPRGDCQFQRTRPLGGQARSVARAHRDAPRRGDVGRAARGRFLEGAVHGFGRGDRDNEGGDADRAAVSEVTGVDFKTIAAWIA